MNLERLCEELNRVRNGVFTRLSYHSCLPVKKEFKDLGIKVVKNSDITVRFGINYRNIECVKNKEIKEGTKKRTNNYETIIKNKLVYNTNTEKYYVCAYPTKQGSNANCKYSVYVNDVLILFDIDKDIIKHLVQDSYWNKSYSETFRVNAENIDRLGKYIAEEE